MKTDKEKVASDPICTSTTDKVSVLLSNLNVQSGGDGTTWGGWSEGCDQIERDIINLVQELEAKSIQKEHEDKARERIYATEDLREG